jgi:hypothetical protein
MWNGFDFYFYLDRMNRIVRILFACGEGPFGRRPYYPNDPVNPVQLFSLKKNPFLFFFLKYGWFRFAKINEKVLRTEFVATSIVSILFDSVPSPQSSSLSPDKCASFDFHSFRDK